MAKFQLELPSEIMKDFQKVHDNADKILGDMTKAGADVAMNNIKANLPLSEMGSHVKLSRTYKTPSDDGINTKVYFSGYLPFSDANRKYFTRSGRSGGKTYSTAKGVPVDFLAILFEYGRSNLPFPKRPFFRKAFNKSQIENAMLDAQRKSSGGLLT